MKLKNKIMSSYQILNFVLFKKRVPVAVRINLNNKCINKCKYCNVWNTHSSEMSTQEILSLIDGLAEMGTQRISFSGGEPLLRKDIGQIIKYCKSRGMSPSMNSTGFQLNKKIKELNELDLIKLSLDGKEKNNDAIRGTSSYKITMEAVQVAKKNNLRFSFCTTLTNKSTNVNNIKYLLDLAEKHNTFVAFQPLKIMFKGVKDLTSIYPSQKSYKQVIKFLIEKKKQKRWKKHIRNSLSGLKHIEDWPNYKKLKCNAGNVFIIIQPNGDVIPCDRIQDSYKTKIPNYLRLGLQKSFNQLPLVNCSGCGFCGALELNFLCNLKINILSEIRQVLS